MYDQSYMSCTWMFIYGSSCSTIYDQQIDRKLCEIWNHIWTFKCSYMIKKIIICRHIKSLYMIDHIWLSSMITYLLIYEHIGSYMIRCLMFIYEHLTAYDSHIRTLPYMSSYMNTFTFVMFDYWFWLLMSQWTSKDPLMQVMWALTFLLKKQFESETWN